MHPVCVVSFLAPGVHLIARQGSDTARPIGPMEASGRSDLWCARLSCQLVVAGGDRHRDPRLQINPQCCDSTSNGERLCAAHVIEHVGKYLSFKWKAPLCVFVSSHVHATCETPLMLTLRLLRWAEPKRQKDLKPQEKLLINATLWED